MTLRAWRTIPGLLGWAGGCAQGGLDPEAADLAGLQRVPQTIAAWEVQGTAPSENLAGRVALADFDGDGFDDAVVGTPGYDDATPYPAAGRLQVYPGAAEGLALAPAWTLHGDLPWALMGNTLGTADTNADGYADLIVADRAGWACPRKERVQLFFGSAAGLGAVAAWALVANGQNTGLGGSVSGAGDVNGDGYDDILVGACELTSAFRDEGAAFLYLGGPAGPEPAPAWTSWGGAQEIRHCEVAAAGDVNADGYDDVIVGAPWYSGGENVEGRVQLYLGEPAGLGALPTWSWEPDQAGAVVGDVVGFADLDGDGYGDVVVGAPAYLDATGVNVGAAFVFRGQVGGLSALPVATLRGTLQHAGFGGSLAGADLNGDGTGDLVVGRDNGGLLTSGPLSAWLGSSLGLGQDAAWDLALGDDEGDLGVATGDVDGDGFDDVLVGEPLGLEGLGRALLVPGDADTDADGVLDRDDTCPGFDDHDDADADEDPDGCDPCPTTGAICPPPSLVVSGSCAGTVDLTGSGFPASTLVGVYAAPAPGAGSIGTGPCAGVVTGLSTPTLLGSRTTDAAGEFVVTLPAPVCGSFVQAFDEPTCTPTGVGSY